jgi:hypothetical protein
MRNLLFVLITGMSLVLSSYSTKSSNAVFLDDYPNAMTSTITGANDVVVYLTRDGADAGQGWVTFEVDILFNDNVLQTFTFTMYDSETSRTEHVQGPNPTAWAEVRDVRVIGRG